MTVNHTITIKNPILKLIMIFLIITEYFWGVLQNPLYLDAISAALYVITFIQSVTFFLFGMVVMVLPEIWQAYTETDEMKEDNKDYYIIGQWNKIIDVILTSFFSMQCWNAGLGIISLVYGVMGLLSAVIVHTICTANQQEINDQP